MPKEIKLFDKEESLTFIKILYKQAKHKGDNRWRLNYSFLQQDKKGKQFGIDRLRKFAINNSKDIEYAAIFDNISGERIENVIINGKLV